jgi:hypothetical protein
MGDAVGYSEWKGPVVENVGQEKRNRGSLQLKQLSFHSVSHRQEGYKGGRNNHEYLMYRRDEDEFSGPR